MYIKPPRYTSLCMTLGMKNKRSKILGIPGPQTNSEYFISQESCTRKCSLVGTEVDKGSDR